MTAIPFFKQSEINAPFANAAIEAIAELVAGRSPLVLGKFTTAFENQFADYLGCANFTMSSNGLDALILSLQALGIGEGDEVIVPAHTYIATWIAPLQLGCRLVVCPVKDNNLLIDEQQLANLTTDRTRCIMPVHLYGNACNMQRIMDIASRAGSRVVEDAAQAHGARDHLDGQRVGCHGDAVAFSFYPTKNLGAMGECGGVATNNIDVDASLRSWRNYGRRADDGATNQHLGMNGRADEIQAAFLASKLKALDRINAHRRTLVKAYAEGLNQESAGLPLEFIQYADLSAPHLAIVRCLNSSDRDPLIQHLRAAAIDVAIHYRVPCHAQPCVKAVAERVFISQAARIQSQAIADSIISLPMSECHSMDEVKQVIKAIRNYFIH
jgi:dTDP-4-amino-4,6-dideoxygalactose transaminase